MPRQTFRAHVALYAVDGTRVAACECLLEVDAAPFARSVWGGSLSGAADLTAGRYQMRFPNNQIREVDLGPAEASDRRFTGIGTLPMP